MTASRIAILVASLAFIQQTNAQNSVLAPISESPKNALTSHQTGSPNNYALLQPIASDSPASQAVSPVLAATTSKPGVLQPISEKAESTIAPAESVTDSIKVTPLSFRKGEFDIHEFKIHNAGTKTLRDSKVLLKAPEGSLVQQVIPKPDSVDGTSVLFSIGELPAGSHQIVEIMIEYSDNKLARFESFVLSEKWEAAGGSKMVSAVAPPTPKGTDEGIVRLLQPRNEGMLSPSNAMTASTAKTVADRGIVKAAASTIAIPLAPLKASSPSRYPSNEIYGEETKSQSSETSQAKPVSQSVEANDTSTVKAWLQGAQNATVGQEAEYSIDVQNSASENANGIIVQLSIPQDMKVTVLDRAAWYDAENRKVSWEIDSLAPQSTETIRYKAVFKTAGQQQQSIVVGHNQTVQCTSSLKTTAR